MMEKLKRLVNIVLDIIVVIVIICVASYVITSFASDKPSVFGYRALYIMSGSMEPTVKTGQLVLTKTINSEDDIKADSIVGYKNADGKIIVHRVIDIKTDGEEISYQFKGDNNEAPDEEYVLFENCIYKVILY